MLETMRVLLSATKNKLSAFKNIFRKMLDKQIFGCYNEYVD